MHQSSLDKMTQFVAEFLAPYRGQPLRIADLGSLDVNGSYRPLFDDPAWQYLGLDQSAGPNVDAVLEQPYHWRALASNSVDVLISGQTFEHIEFFWITLDEMARVVKPGGLICLIAPSRGYEHRYPVDCWRFYPDGFRALARYSGLEVLHVATQWQRLGYTVDDSDDWGDTLAVLRRPLRQAWHAHVLLAARRGLNRWCLRGLGLDKTRAGDN